MMLPCISRIMYRRRLLVLATTFLGVLNFLALARGASPSGNSTANPIDEARVFALQHYFDFLSREPDDAGLGFWTNEIDACTTPDCVERKRINVSAAFFLSAEFQETGFFAICMHKAAYGNRPDNPRYLAFLRDQAKLGEGVRIGETGAQERLEENKRRFAEEFVGRAEFVARYPESTTGGAYVDALYANAGIAPTQEDRDAAFIAFGNGGAQGRARALRVVAERETVRRGLSNTAFVLMQYFGYLRRNPDDAPEPGRNFDGYNFWLSKLNAFGGDYIAAEMVKAFIFSDEYRARFTATKLTLSGNRHDPLLFRAERPPGATVEYFGEKNEEGLAVRLTAMRVRETQGATSTYFFDTRGRPILMEAANGVVFHLDWRSDSIVLLTATSPDGSVQVPVPVTLSGTVSPQFQKESIASTPSLFQSANPTVLSESEIRAEFLQKVFPAALPPSFSLPHSPFDSTAEVRVTHCGGAEAVDDAAVRIRIGDWPVEDAIPAALSAFGTGAYRASIPTPDANAGSRIGIKFENAKRAAATGCDAARALASPVGQPLCASVASTIAAYSGGVAPPAAPVAAIEAACPVLVAGLGEICAGDDRAINAVVNRADAAPVLSLQPVATLDGTTLAGETRTGVADLAQPFVIDFPCRAAERIEVSPATVSIDIADSVRFNAVVKNRDGETVVVPLGGLRWRIDNPPGATVATVNAVGDITAVGEGNATLVVTETRSGKSASALVSVSRPVSRVEIAASASSVDRGRSIRLTATARDSQDNAIAIAPSRFQWTSANAAVATIKGAGNEVDVRGLSLGMTQIAVVETRSGTRATLGLTVEPPVKSVEISSADNRVEVGKSLQLTATARDAGGNVVALALDKFEWRSTNTATATVDAVGKVTGRAPGEVQIVVTEIESGASATAQINVDIRVERVVVSPQNPSVQVCGAQQLSATAFDALGNVVESANFQWRTSHRGIVNVSDGGVATGITTGTAEITATETESGKSASVAVESLAATTHVLEFDRSPKTVDYYLFWEANINLGHFFWEFWAVPNGIDAGGTYLLSDGYGGAHALLFGFGYLGAREPGRYQLFGNIYDGVNIVFIGSDEGPAPEEWGHFAVGWDGQQVVTYFNGVPVGATPFAGPRRTPGFYGGGGRLLIGGSDHNNLVGKIAQLRGYEGSNPRVGADGASVFATFAPQTVFRDGGNVASNFFCQRNPVDDLSEGHQGSLHTGRLRGTLHPYGLLRECPDCPLPKYVVDPTAPKFLDEANAAPPAPQGTPAPAPPGALVFDSFSRPNSTYAFNGRGGLGATESGTAGALPWRTNSVAPNPQPFGILNGRAVLLADAPSLAWIPTGSTTGNFDVRASRDPGTRGAGVSTGVGFRVVDASNFFFAYTVGDGIDSAGAQKLTVGYYLNGARTDLATNVVMPTRWTTLRVVTTGDGQIAVYADATPLYSTVNGLMASAAGAGVYNNARGLALANRWDNFTVYAAP